MDLTARVVKVIPSPMRSRDPRIVRAERLLRVERDNARSYLESVEAAWRAANRALTAHLGGRGGGRPVSREEHTESETALADSIAEILVDGTTRTPDAIVAALGENGIEIERAEVNVLLHSDSTRPDGRFERVGAGYRIRKATTAMTERKGA